MDTAMVGGQMSRLDEALGSYMEYSQQKKEKLAELGSMSKIDRLTEAVQKVQEGVSGAGDTAMAISQFGTAMLEKKGVAGLKGLLARYRGRGQAEPEAEGGGAETQAPVQPEVSGTRMPEGFTRMTGGAVGEAEEMGTFRTAGAEMGRMGEYIKGSAGPRLVPQPEATGGEPIQMGGVEAADFDPPPEQSGWVSAPEPRTAPAVAPRTAPAGEGEYEYTGGTSARPVARPVDPAVIRGRSAATAGELEQAEMSRTARIPQPRGEQFRYSRPTDPAQTRGLAERYGGAGEEGYGGLRGSSLIARATRQAPDPMSAFEGTRYAREGGRFTQSRIPQPQGEVSFRGYRPQAERVAQTERMPRPTPEPTQAPRVPAAAQVEQRVGAADVEAGGDVARTAHLQDVAVNRIAELRGERVGATGGDTPLAEDAGGDDEAVGSLMDTIGGWSGALNVLGGVGMLAGLGGAIYGGIEAGKQESEEQAAIRGEQRILSRPTNVNFGSLALPTYDTSAMRGGGGMGHF